MTERELEYYLLVELVSAAKRLSEHWEQHGSQILNTGYPFEESFDDIVNYLIDWKHAVSKE